VAPEGLEFRLHRFEEDEGGRVPVYDFWPEEADAPALGHESEECPPFGEIVVSSEEDLPFDPLAADDPESLINTRASEVMLPAYVICPSCGELNYVHAHTILDAFGLEGVSEVRKEMMAALLDNWRQEGLFSFVAIESSGDAKMHPLVPFAHYLVNILLNEEPELTHLQILTWDQLFGQHFDYAQYGPPGLPTDEVSDG
jgi:hypothetical protein